MRISLINAALLVVICPIAASGGVKRVWVVNDSEKIERDARQHPAAERNSAWDGRVARVFGARNEIVALQVIVEADARGVNTYVVDSDRAAAKSADGFPPAFART